MQKNITPITNFDKVLSVPSDKSISHRAVMLGSVAKGYTYVHNALISEDILATADCMSHIGAKCEIKGYNIKIEPVTNIVGASLYAGNSGTTMRLLTGLLSSYEDRKFTFAGDASLAKRPMGRIAEPLKQMGADIELTNGNFCPFKIKGRHLHGIDYITPVSSAQVKSAILFAGLNADGQTSVTEKTLSRDHSERMLKAMGADIKTESLKTTISKSQLQNIEITVPGDISSAAFLLVLAAAKKGFRVTVKNVSLNPTRTGIIDVLRLCGADIKIENFNDGYEPYGDITVKGGVQLKPFSIGGEIIPRLIDEIPVLAVLACFCEGVSTISGAEELKVKESNRIDAVVTALKSLGAQIEAKEDGMQICGKGFLEGGAIIETHNDHRMAMSMAIAGALSKKGATILNAEIVSVSYPDFYSVLKQ